MSVPQLIEAYKETLGACRQYLAPGAARDARAQRCSPSCPWVRALHHCFACTRHGTFHKCFKMCTEQVESDTFERPVCRLTNARLPVTHRTVYERLPTKGQAQRDQRATQTRAALDSARDSSGIKRLIKRDRPKEPVRKTAQQRSVVLSKMSAHDARRGISRRTRHAKVDDRAQMEETRDVMRTQMEARLKELCNGCTPADLAPNEWRYLMEISMVIWRFIASHASTMCKYTLESHCAVVLNAVSERLGSAKLLMRGQSLVHYIPTLSSDRFRYDARGVRGAQHRSTTAMRIMQTVLYSEAQRNSQELLDAVARVGAP